MMLEFRNLYLWGFKNLFAAIFCKENASQNLGKFARANFENSHTNHDPKFVCPASPSLWFLLILRCDNVWSFHLTEFPWKPFCIREPYSSSFSDLVRNPFSMDAAQTKVSYDKQQSRVTNTCIKSRLQQGIIASHNGRIKSKLQQRRIASHNVRIKRELQQRIK